MATIRNCINDTSTELFIKDDTDNTKVLYVNVAGITTSTTRTWTVDDRSINFDAVPTSIVTDSGTCTPASGSFSIVGSGGTSTSASGSVITVTSGSGTGMSRVDSSSTPVSMVADTEYTNQSVSASFEIPSTVAVGTVFTVVNNTTSRMSVSANTGQTIRYLASSSTSGGTIFSDTDYAAISVKCTVANTTFVVMYATGTWTTT